MKPQESIDRTPEFDSFVRRYSGALRRFFQTRVLDWADIDDLIQEVFLRLARRGLADIDNIEGYMFQAAANVLRDRIRHRATKFWSKETQLQESVTEDTAFSPERVLLGREAIQLVVEILKELPERTQQVFVLGCFEEMTQGETAKKLGISLSTVENTWPRLWLT